MDARANNGVYKQRTGYPEAMLKESVHLNAAAAPHIPSRRQRKKWPAATIARVFQRFFFKKKTLSLSLLLYRVQFALAQSSGIKRSKNICLAISYLIPNAPHNQL